MKITCLTLLFLHLILPVCSETHRVYLGEFNLIGPVPRTGTSQIHQVGVDPGNMEVFDGQGILLGMVPSPFHAALLGMHSKGLQLYLEISYRYVLPRPHQYLRVSVWTETDDLSLIEPLIYHYPIHTEEDLEDYE